MEESSKRVRMNINSTAKGQVQFEITCEFETLEETAANLSEGIDKIRGIIREKGLIEAGTV